MLNGGIDPFIMVCANNQFGPFGGTMYMNSPLWGDFETFNFIELVDYIEDNYRALSDPNKRALMGQSMGATGCFENGPKYKNKFRAIAAHGYSGVMEYCLDNWLTALLDEQVSGPPYFYNFSSGEIFTKLCFLESGALAPNLNSPQTYINPTTVEFILDDQGAFIDTVVSKWLKHSGHKLVQGLTPADDFGILFGCGQNDELLFYPGAVALKDSLDAYGIPSQFFSHSGGHAMPNSFKVEAYTFLDSIFNIESSACLPEGITFTTQAQIDNFQTNYPGCSEIEGDVEFSGSPYEPDTIKNLNGLSVLTSIGGNFDIENCMSLNSLQGLQNLQFIGGSFSLNLNAFSNLEGLQNLAIIVGDFYVGEGEYLNNLMGLENLQTIGGSVNFGYGTMGGPACTQIVSLTGLENLNSIGGDLNFYSTSLLEELSGLSGLTHIGGDLWIYANEVLKSLAGLGNIESGSISNLNINSNYLLSTCEVQSICDYLASPNGIVEIYGNATGCNSPEEVEEACFSSVEESYNNIEISISPNPVNYLAILNLNIHSKSTLDICIYNITGICLKSWQFQNQQAGEKVFKLDLKDLPAGVYFCRIQIGNEMVTKKIIKL